MQNLSSPKNLLILGVLVVVLLIGGYLVMNRGTAPAPTDIDLETEQEVEEITGDEDTMTVVLSAQNDSGQDGEATLTEEDGQVKVEIEIPASEDGASQPAHIHMGACPEPGSVVYPLTNVIDGESETMLDVTLAELRDQLPLAINVHKSAAESSVYTSCGDLQ